VNRTTAHALAAGGAVISVVSLVTPWYVERAGSLTGIGESGAHALGTLSVLLIVLAIGAGWSTVARIHVALPVGSACILAFFVLLKLASPPDATRLLTGPASGDSIQSQFLRAFAEAITKNVGLHYAPAWGIWLATIGAATALVGTIAAAMGDTA
jgi:hypothetical protein